MKQTKPQSGKFLKTFFKERKQVGAVAPSSRFLVKKMCDAINFSEAKVIVELGPGTGVFTQEILNRASLDSKIFVFELNEDFCRILESKFNDQRIILVNDSAEKLTAVLKEHQIENADAVLSSLPLTVIPEPVKSNILKASFDSLKPQGIYVQYQYSLNAKKLIEKQFGKLNLRFSLINIPPAFIYVAKK
ncbi:MAG: class I SAM-dependent methyltransferase [Crocinitomicaceae bacterium]